MLSRISFLLATAALTYAVTDCCESGSCTNRAVAHECVCKFDPFCCTPHPQHPDDESKLAWDGQCISEAAISCFLDCVESPLFIRLNTGTPLSSNYSVQLLNPSPINAISLEPNFLGFTLVPATVEKVTTGAFDLSLIVIQKLFTTGLLADNSETIVDNTGLTPAEVAMGLKAIANNTEYYIAAVSVAASFWGAVSYTFAGKSEPSLGLVKEIMQLAPLAQKIFEDIKELKDPSYGVIKKLEIGFDLKEQASHVFKVLGEGFDLYNSVPGSLGRWQGKWVSGLLYGGAWDTKFFAGWLVNTVFASASRRTAPGKYTFHFTGEADLEGASNVMNLWQLAVRTAPLSLLRCSVDVTVGDSADSLSVTSITIHLRDGTTKIVTPPDSEDADSAPWIAAIRTASGISFWCFQVFHMGYHYQAPAAEKMLSSAAGSGLFQLLGPQLTAAQYAWVEMQTALLSPTGSFYGSVWDAPAPGMDLPSLVNTLGNYLLYLDDWTALSTPSGDSAGVASDYAWWGGGANLIAADIHSFADAFKALTDDQLPGKDAAHHEVEANLRRAGILKEGEMDVSTFIKSVVGAPAIVHSNSYCLRVFFTGQVLLDSEYLEDCFNGVPGANCGLPHNFITDARYTTGLTTAFATSEFAAYPLADPSTYFFNDDVADVLTQIVADFQSSLSVSQEKIEAKFKPSSEYEYKPYYFMTDKEAGERNMCLLPAAYF